MRGEREGESEQPSKLYVCVVYGLLIVRYLRMGRPQSAHPPAGRLRIANVIVTSAQAPLLIGALWLR